MWSQHSKTGRDQQPCRGRGDSAENVSDYGNMSALEKQHTECETNRPGDQQETQHSVRPGHELAKAHDVGEFLLARPLALIDGDSLRPDDPATSAKQRNIQEHQKQCGE
jgi:hypothetical protein